MTNFPNKAGDHPDNDDILTKELENAGIEAIKLPFKGKDEVRTKVVGSLYGWVFRRAWYYWMAEGPGIELEAAERLHATHGKVVRVAGHCGCPSPKEWYKGLACGDYHVDTQEGLKALADTIKELVKKHEI